MTMQMANAPPNALAAASSGARHHRAKATGDDTESSNEPIISTGRLASALTGCGPNCPVGGAAACCATTGEPQVRQKASDPVIPAPHRWQERTVPTGGGGAAFHGGPVTDRKSTRLNSSHLLISY